MVDRTQIKSLFWDFDGVIMNSMAIRDQGFLEVLKNFPNEEVAKLMIYHQENGGLSRYHKFRYFFENIRKESVSDEDIQEYAVRFSQFVIQYLSNSELLIMDSLNFIEKYYHQIDMHIVSGSDQTELRGLCKELNISHLFKSINGSPTKKTDLVKQLLIEHGYNPSNVCLIGDSKNDLEAAMDHGLVFWGYNNELLRKPDYPYIESFEQVIIEESPI